MEFLKKINHFSFYYFFPLSFGFLLGLIIRDNQMISLNKKIAMTLCDYYEAKELIPDEEVLNQVKELKFLMKKKLI